MLPMPSARQNPQTLRTQQMSLPRSFPRLPHWDKPTFQMQFSLYFMSNSILYYSYGKTQQWQIRLLLMTEDVLSTRATGSSQCPRFHYRVHPVSKAPASLEEGIIFSYSLFHILSYSYLLKTNRKKQAEGKLSGEVAFGTGRPLYPSREGSRRGRRWSIEHKPTK